MRKLTTKELVGQRPKPEVLRKMPRHPFYVVLDNVRSLENVGLVFRICDALRVEKLFLTGFTGYPALPNDTRPYHIWERADRWIRKTAIKTVDFVPWEYFSSALTVIKKLKEKGVQIVSLEQTDVSLNYAQADYQFPLCLILGHERLGVDNKILKLSDLIVEIPMHGQGNSLNVAMSLSIVGYELISSLMLTFCKQIKKLKG